MLETKTWKRFSTTKPFVSKMRRGKKRSFYIKKAIFLVFSIIFFHKTSFYNYFILKLQEFFKFKLIGWLVFFGRFDFPLFFNKHKVFFFSSCQFGDVTLGSWIISTVAFVDAMRIVFLTSQRFREVKTQLIFKLVRIGHPFNNFAVIGFFGQKIYKSLQCRKLSRLVHVGNGQTSSKMNDFKTFNVFVIFFVTAQKRSAKKRTTHTYWDVPAPTVTYLNRQERKKRNKKNAKYGYFLLSVFICSGSSGFSFLWIFQDHF